MMSGSQSQHRNRIGIAIEPSAAPELIGAVNGGSARLAPVETADALIWTSPTQADQLREVVGGSPRLRWVQLPWAGVEEFAAAGIFDRERIWTSAKNLYSRPVAEHAFTLALSAIHEVPRYSRAAAWSRPYGQVLSASTVVIVGGGGIAEAIARLHEPLGCDIISVTRSGAKPDWAGRSFSFADRLQAVALADLTYLALPLVEESIRFVDSEFLAVLGPDGYLVNVARGRHVDQEALVHALATKSIAGAALDVTDPEPLPQDHPLWGLDNCLITPHTAIPRQIAEQLLRERILENIRRFRNGEGLLGEIDPEKGY